MFSVGQIVRINDTVIPTDAKVDDLFGMLGVPGLFRYAKFEIVSLFDDATIGAAVQARILNPDDFVNFVPGVKKVTYEGDLVLSQAEIIPANQKITLDYIIKLDKTKEQLVSELFAERQELKNSGLDKRHKAMRDNWKKIQVLRGELAGPTPDLGMATVILPRQRMKFTVPVSTLPTDEESTKVFQQILTGMMRMQRNYRRKLNVEEKEVFSNVKCKKLGGVYLNKNSLLEAYGEMMRTTLETDKKPTDSRSNYVGVEIEFIYTGNYEHLKKLLIDKKLHKHVCLKDDGSLRACHNSGYTVKELTLLTKTKDVHDVLAKLDSVLRDPKIDGYANRSCGLHVHLDVRNRDAGLVFKNLVRVQNLMRAAQPVGRINNTYCKPNESDVLSPSIVAGQGDGNRYLVVNPNSYVKHKSIEIRVHEGTTDCESISNWVSFLEAIASHKTEIPKNTIKFAEDLASKYSIEIPTKAIEYIDRRIEKFNSLSVIA